LIFGKAMRTASTATGYSKQSFRPWFLLGLLGAVLLVLFYKSLDPHQILFANDFPLGALKADCNRLPDRFAGTWRNLAWLGGEAPAASPDITMLLMTLVSPVAYLKIYAPATLLFLGFSAWLFFRQLNFSPMVCVLGGVAMGLNAHFFSNACWGLGNWNLSTGCTFLAMAALYAKSIPKFWEKAVLAGLAVGMGIMEGYDVGAILSVYVGIFIVFRAFNDEAPVPKVWEKAVLACLAVVCLIYGYYVGDNLILVAGAILGVYAGIVIVFHAFNDESPFGRRVFNAVFTETLVVLFAAIIAFHTMKTLVRTQIEGVAAMEQDAETKQTRWNSATQWSLPKMETLQVLVPGLFGYRLSGNINQTNHSGAYWGLIGQDPRIADLGSDDPIVRSNVVGSALKLPDSYLTELNKPNRYARTAGMQAVTKKTGIYWRYNGSSECAGMMVSLLAIFGLANFFRKDSAFAKYERAAVGYWGVVAIFSVLASWGRFGFVYQFLYKLPEVSTIRNPIKFMHPFHIAWVILAAYGMEVLYRRYLKGPEKSASGFLPQDLQIWWQKVAGFDRKWTIFMMILAGAAAAGAAMLFVNKGALIHHLEEQSFALPLPKQIATFCLERAGAFLVFLAAGVLVVAVILSGAWSGSRSNWAWCWLAGLIIFDLARADFPWIHYFDYNEKYALNSVTDFLLDKPWEHRVIGKLEPRGPGSGIQPGFGQLYFFWLQNDFPYHNIQTLDFPQAAHMPDLDRLYLKAFELGGDNITNTDLRPAVRLWQLTNTRYVLGSASSMEFLNRRADPAHHSFKLQGVFNRRLKPGVLNPEDAGDLTVESGQRGEFGIIEYPLALPRAKLYSNWRTPTNDDATLQVLADPAFEPWATVLIATNTPLPQPNSALTADAGTVTITGYNPKYVRLEADAKTPAVLLLNDRIDPDWQVRVDGQSNLMLRCNYIMRGVSLTPGHHIVEFQFKPLLKTLYISLSAIVIGIILAGYLIITRVNVAASAAQHTPPPVPVTPAATQVKRQKGNGKAKGG
jgi:hypothetical protein